MTATWSRAEYDAHLAKLSPEARARHSGITHAVTSTIECQEKIPGLIHVPRPSTWKEKDEQRECFRLLRAVGWLVMWLSQAQRSQQTPGLPDLFARHPRRQLLLWCEIKRPDDPSEYTPAQRAFADERLPCEGYVLGTEANLRQYLEAQGFELPPPSYHVTTDG